MGFAFLAMLIVRLKPQLTCCVTSLLGIPIKSIGVIEQLQDAACSTHELLFVFHLDSDLGTMI